jgi:hypothetical protein
MEKRMHLPTTSCQMCPERVLPNPAANIELTTRPSLYGNLPCLRVLPQANGACLGSQTALWLLQRQIYLRSNESQGIAKKKKKGINK